MPETKTNRLTPEEKTAARRQAIIDAAYECFLQYGFAKTSLDDIAKKARLSRPLLYLQFRNKEELFVETLRDLYTRHIDGARPALELEKSKKEKLLAMYEALLLDTWSRIVRSPSGKEFVDECRRHFPQLEAEYEKKALELLLPVFEDRGRAELFMLCIDGLYSDQPTTEVLRGRIRQLADLFLPGE